MVGALVGLAVLARARTSPGAAPVPPASEPDRPNIVLVDIDTLRADRLDAKQGDRWVMPNLRALAARGVRFERMVSQSGWTAPALYSLLTGHYPLTFEVAGGALPTRPPDTRLLPEILGLYGYETTALWGFGVPLAHDFAGAAFARSDTLPRDAASAETLGAQLDDWLEAPPKEPFFLFVHHFDVQVPGRAFGEANLHRFTGPHPDCPPGGYEDTWRVLRERVGDDAARAEVIAHYDGVVGGYDEVLGAFLDRLADAGLADDTWIVVTSNHGEDLFEHQDSVTHGSLYDVVTRVPLVVVGPGVAPGRSVDTVVQTVDLAPTLLDLAGIPRDVGMAGTSLRPLLQDPDGGAFPDRPVFSRTNANNVSLRQGTAKLVLRNDATDWRPAFPGPAGGQAAPSKEPWYELYDLAADPGETHDLAAERPEELTRLRDTLTAWRTANEAEQAGTPAALVNEEMRARLRESGYWDIVGSEDPDTERPRDAR